MTHRKQGMQLADYIRELTLDHEHAEHYTIRIAGEWRPRDHRTSVPSLIDQLRRATRSGQGDDRAGEGYKSRPTAPLEALDTLARIDLEAARWLRLDLHEDDPADTAACIRLLHGLSASADPVMRRAIERDVRRWWTQARIVTGWDAPAWRPMNTCPMCGERGGLRVKLADRMGMCVDCGDTWDETNIGLLADHIRAESEAEREPREGRGPCWCPLPMPAVPDLKHMCPGCGSARCRHALGARLLDSVRGIGA